MNTSARFFLGVLVPAFILAGVTAIPATAEVVKPKVLVENDKVRVYEVRFKPGDEGEALARPFRVVRALQGGTIMRTYADGKTETVEWKTGEVKLRGPDPVFTPKNVGKTQIWLYIVQPK